MPEFHPGSKHFAMRLLLILLFAVCLLVPFPAWAGEALVNSEASVDVTGKDAADARAQAMVKGERDALVSLLDKLTTPEQVHTIMNSLDEGKVAGIVRGTEVLDEKITSNRYRARLLVTFDGDQISSLIGKGTSAPGEIVQPATTGSFLVLPGYEEGGVAMLWEESNPWMPVWRSVSLEANGGDLVVPYGDNTDISVIDAKTLASATYASLAPLTIRYGISDIVLLQAKFVQTPDMTLTVVKRRINRTANEVNLLTYRADPQETKEMLLARAARDIIDSLERKKSEETETVKTVRGGERNTVMVLASITTLASWTQLRAKLAALPMIDNLDILAISPHQVDVLVHYRGSPDSLAGAITAQNLRLVKNPTYWVVSRD